jgi:opacity protein-like surface antigen
MRSIHVIVLISALFALVPGGRCEAQDQGFGLGARLSMVRGDVQAETSAERFTGGQLRARVSRRTAIELSLDRRTQTNEALTERVRDLPFQASLLLFPVRSTLSPYVLGGVGWYSHRVETLAATEVTASESSRRFGYHAGLGGEMRLGRHAGLHADYRYTFLRFGSEESATLPAARASDGAGFIGSRFLPSYEGSMWTAGLTVYF